MVHPLRRRWSPPAHSRQSGATTVLARQISRVSRSEGNGSALDVRELFRHLAVAHFEEVDSPDVAVAPVEPPAHHRPIARDHHLLGLECGARGVVEELVPESAHRARPDEPLTVRRRQRVLEDAVVGHERHHGVDVVTAESLVEGGDRGFGRGAHAWPIMRAMTSPRFGPPLPNGTECTRCANTISATSPTWFTPTFSALSYAAFA